MSCHAAEESIVVVIMSMSEVRKMQPKHTSLRSLTPNPRITTLVPILGFDDASELSQQLRRLATSDISRLQLRALVRPRSSQPGCLGCTLFGSFPRFFFPLLCLPTPYLFLFECDRDAVVSPEPPCIAWGARCDGSALSSYWTALASRAAPHGTGDMPLEAAP